ncbi:MAG TPA: SDR family NAD(P)-dependent oxidoreductase [Burkholderiaceae bacterium]|nr:SDR family NAD(P)-dependent oxidoreductase [Burkholderiaceae bacterium]
MSYKSVFRPDLFEGQVIIVTGGGSGIGRCTAHELASLRATVAIVGRDPEKLAKVQAEIEADGGKVSTHVCDIRDEAQVGAAIDAVLAQHGRIDGLVNNAGGQYRMPLRDISTKGFESVVRNNLTGGFIFMREAYTRWMEKHNSARHTSASFARSMKSPPIARWPGNWVVRSARVGCASRACDWTRRALRSRSIGPMSTSKPPTLSCEPSCVNRRRR